MQERLHSIHISCPQFLGSPPKRRGARGQASPKKEQTEQHFGAAGKKDFFGLTRDAAAAFMTADVDGSKSLDFDEFVEILPADMKAELSVEQCRELFDSADTDGSGDISLDEFFLWTLAIVEQHTGMGLDSVWRRYDIDGEGKLNAAEFALACEDLGFGAMSQELFLEMDPDESGTISADEVMSVLRGRGASREAKRFLYGLASGAAGVKVDINASKWVLPTDDTRAVRTQLVHLLHTHNPPAKVSDLFDYMTHGSGNALIEGDSYGMNDVGESGTLHFAMDLLGLPRGNQWLVAELFKEMDADYSGQVSETDFTSWLSDAQGAAVTLRNITLIKPLPCLPDGWSPEALHKALQRMLMNAGLSPVDLLRAWDNDMGGQLERKEFVAHIKDGARKPRKRNDPRILLVPALGMPFFYLSFWRVLLMLSGSCRRRGGMGGVSARGGTGDIRHCLLRRPVH